MCKPLDEYQAYLERLVKEKSPLLFSNGGIDYASILMSILLKNTKGSVCMFCEGFKPDLITKPAYWEALTGYLGKNGTTLRVIVNSDAYVKAEPLQTLFAEQQKRGDDDSIQVHLINEAGREKIKEQFNGALNNFAIFDDDMYRLEYDPADYKAFGSFNDPNDSRLLRNLFDEVFEKMSLPIDESAA